VFASVHAGPASEAPPPDFFAIAAKLRADGIFAYRSALELHGIADSGVAGVVLVSLKTGMRRRTPLGSYQFVPPPKVLKAIGQIDVETIHMVRSRIALRVTSLERTVVDVLNSPKLSGGVDAVIRSLDRIDALDAKRVVAYTMLLRKPTLAAVVGWWLDRHRSTLDISNDVLRPLRYALPVNPLYTLGAKPGDAVVMSPWQLLVPKRIARLAWARR